MIYAIENQSLFDVAIQESGSVLAAFDWALKNGLSLTEDLVPGQKLTTPNSNFNHSEVAEYFKRKNIKVATAIKKELVPPGLGIEYMRVGINFKVG